MRKKVFIAIASLLAFGEGAWAQTTSFPRHGETGQNSENNPYIISSVEDFNALAADVNSGNSYSGVFFKLNATLDYSGITLADGSNFTPIGYGDDWEGEPFSGTFDGGEFTISGITVNTPDVWGVGLFGYISKATIKNVTITNSSFIGNGFVGAIAGGSARVDSYGSPTIENCHVTNSVTVEAKDFDAGGIIGSISDNITIEKCTSTATITGSSCVGGIVGTVYDDTSDYKATLTDSYYLGSLPAIGENGGENGHATINITLLDDDSNATVTNSMRISNYNGETATVTLSGRTLFKDGYWNTLCLPFNVTLAGSPLADADVRTLSDAAFEDAQLTLTFNEPATPIAAGTPFIIKWENSDNIVSPKFEGVTISASINDKKCDISDGVSITFAGTNSPVTLMAGDNTNLYLGEENNLYYPSENGYITINACRAYFQLDGITAGEPKQGAPVRFVLNFDGETTGIVSTTNDTNFTNSDHAWYDLNGHRLNGKPTVKGVYINNGKKVVVK